MEQRVVGRSRSLRSIPCLVQKGGSGGLWDTAATEPGAQAGAHGEEGGGAERGWGREEGKKGRGGEEVSGREGTEVTGGRHPGPVPLCCPRAVAGLEGCSPAVRRLFRDWRS